MPDDIMDEQKHVQESLQRFEDTIKVNQNQLDCSISRDELEKNPKHLKPRKACGPENILVII